MAYPPIVGSGRNSVILHYEPADKPLDDGAMIVNDTACEYGMYAADVTRSYPVSGKFSAEQRAIYEIVLAAQKAAIAAVKPGIPYRTMNEITLEVVVDGLIRLGLLTGDRDELIASGAQRKFYPHGSGHWIGLNVHDPGSYGFPPGVSREERYRKAMTPLRPGMIFTVEPGIYIPEGSTDGPALVEHRRAHRRRDPGHRNRRRVPVVHGAARDRRDRAGDRRRPGRPKALAPRQTVGS